MGAFDNFIRSLDQMGVTEVVLPFLLFFIILYVAISKSGVFAGGGNEQKNNVIVSLILSLLVIIPHVLNKYPRNVDPVDIVNSVLPHFVLILAAIVFFGILLGFFGQKMPWGIGNAWWWFVGGLIVIVWLFGEAAGWFTSTSLSINLQSIIGEDALTVLIMLLVFIGVIWFIVSPDGGKGVLGRLGPSGGAGGGPGGN